MTPSARVTIVVPARDIGNYLSSALNSLQAQTFTQWRAVIVNDESRDNTGRVADEYAAQDPRFTAIHLAKNVGLGEARNIGIRHVDTEYMGFLDGDDEYFPTALERWISVLDQSSSPFAMAAYVRLRPQPDGSYVSGRVQPWVSAATGPSATGIDLRVRPEACGNIVAWSKMYSTAFWQSNSFMFPEGMYEDQLLSQQVYSHAQSFDTIEEPLVRWRIRPGSITGSRDKIAVLRDYLAALRSGFERLQADGHVEAIGYRIRLIRSIDLPPLEAIAETHPDPEYRETLRTFQLWLESLPGASQFPRDPEITAGLAW